VATTWEREKALGLSRRGSKSLLSWVGYIEGKKSHWGQSMRGDWMETVHRDKEEEKKIRVLKETPQWGLG